MRAISSLRGYRWRELPRDIPIGLALTAVLLPEGMAYARLAGLPAVTGLYASIACLVAYALVGPSRTLILGPDSAVSPLIFAALVPLGATNDPGRAVALAGMLGILVGLIEVLLGIGRFGFVATLLSKPVRIGFLNGLALVIVASQLPVLCGFTTDGHAFLGQAGDFIDNLDAFNLPSFLVGVGVAATVLICRRVSRRLPGVLLAVVGATVVSAVADLTTHGVPVLGRLPTGLPGPTLPWTSVDDLAPLATAAIGIVLISLADTIAVSTSLAASRGEHVDPDREIIAVGAANLFTGFFQGFAVSASASRTAVAQDAGAQGQMSAIVGAAGVAALLVFAPGLLTDLPLSALAAVVILAAAKLMDLATPRRFFRSRPTSLVLSLIATLGVVLLGVLPGVGVAVGLSILFFFRRNWWPEDKALGRVPGLRGWHSLRRYPEARTIPGIVVFRWEAPLFFANASLFQERLRTVVRQTEPHPHHVVVQCSAITDIDVTAADMLRDLRRELADQGVQLVFVEMRDRLRDLLADYRLSGDLEQGPFYRSVKEALEAITGDDLDDLGLG